MMDLQRLIEDLKRHEGLRLKPYRCTAGKITIGVGRNLEDVGISEAEAEFLLGNDIQNAEYDVEHIISNYDSLNDARQEVLVNMLFNLGASRFRKFKKFIAAVEAENWQDAKIQMLDSRWAKQVGQRAIELADRMESGI